MQLETFAMERMQSTYENLVDFNLSESGVHPLTLSELVEDPAAREALLGEPLRYTQSNGTPELREAIAGLYPGATRHHVQVTNGGSEANFITIWKLIEPADEVVMMVPNYMQTWGVARAFGASVREWPLLHDGSRWVIDADTLDRLVTPHEADRRVQSEQPDRRTLRRRGAGSDRFGGGAPRRLDPLG